MKNRVNELDVKLLLYAVQKTQTFEKLLLERFDQDVPGEEETEVEGEGAEKKLATFHNAISQCFEPYLNVYIESQDTNLSELIEKFAGELREGTGIPPYQSGDPAPLLPSSSDLFVFYKKCLVQCSQLSQVSRLTPPPLIGFSPEIL